VTYPYPLLLLEASTGSLPVRATGLIV
jgi:hypothetical protein